MKYQKALKILPLTILLSYVLGVVFYVMYCNAGVPSDELGQGLGFVFIVVFGMIYSLPMLIWGVITNAILAGFAFGGKAKPKTTIVLNVISVLLTLLSAVWLVVMMAGFVGVGGTLFVITFILFVLLYLAIIAQHIATMVCACRAKVSQQTV